MSAVESHTESWDCRSNYAQQTFKHDYYRQWDNGP